MPTENDATPQPLMKPNSRMTGYSAGVTFGTVTRMNTSPHMPTIEAPNSVSIGSRPPTLSTQAPNGMRSSEPVSCGAATSRPTSSGERCIDCWNACAAGPYSDDRGEADEEAPGPHDQALARRAEQSRAGDLSWPGRPGWEVGALSGPWHTLRCGGKPACRCPRVMGDAASAAR